jgi:hypothetical protein
VAFNFRPHRNCPHCIWLDVPNRSDWREVGYVVNLKKDQQYINTRFMRDKANSTEDYEMRCLLGEKVYYVPNDKALMPGHIYSTVGMDEWQISKMCEYHFDKATLWDEEEEDGPYVPDAEGY